VNGRLGVDTPGLLDMAGNGLSGFAILETMEHLQELVVSKSSNPCFFFNFSRMTIFLVGQSAFYSFCPTLAIFEN
jgi:hypothetical protein